MHVTVYNAISVDGFIAGLEDSTDWVDDLEYYEAALQQSDAVIYGRRTYDDMVANADFPLPDITNVVITSNPDKYSHISEAIFTSDSAADVLKMLEEQGKPKILIAGGGITNAAFLKAGLVDELVGDLHPIVLGSGIKWFSDGQFEQKLELISFKELERGLSQLRFKVLK